jgi:hypothetical protein
LLFRIRNSSINIKDFNALEIEKRIKKLKAFIRKYSGDKSYKDELKEAKKMIKNLKDMV